MRLLVCGGRDYRNWDRVREVLDREQPDAVITGGAPGADTLAQQWAAERGVPCMVFPAAWPCLGRRAGTVRNGWMLLHGRPDWCIAFPGGRGTDDMTRRCQRAGIPVTSIGDGCSETN